MVLEAHAQQVTRTQEFKGPLPHPDILRKYDEIVPGAAKSIVGSFITEGEHRRECEKRELAMYEDWSRADVGLQSRGQILGFVLSVIGIGGGLLVAAVGAPAAGSFVSSASLAAIVVAFLRQRHPRKEDSEGKHGEGGVTENEPKPPTKR